MASISHLQQDGKLKFLHFMARKMSEKRIGGFQCTKVGHFKSVSTGRRSSNLSSSECSMKLTCGCVNWTLRRQNGGNLFACSVKDMLVIQHLGLVRRVFHHILRSIHSNALLYHMGQTLKLSWTNELNIERWDGLRGMLLEGMTFHMRVLIKRSHITKSFTKRYLILLRKCTISLDIVCCVL